MKRIYLFIVIYFSILNYFQAQSDSVTKRIDMLVEKQLLIPLRKLHEEPKSTSYSRSYIGESYKYEVYQKPTKKSNYYQGELLEYKAQFIKQKFQFRIDSGLKIITVQDKDSKKYLSVEKWINKYKMYKED